MASSRSIAFAKTRAPASSEVVRMNAAVAVWEALGSHAGAQDAGSLGTEFCADVSAGLPAWSVRAHVTESARACSDFQYVDAATAALISFDLLVLQSWLRVFSNSCLRVFSEVFRTLNGVLGLSRCIQG